MIEKTVEIRARWRPLGAMSLARLLAHFGLEDEAMWVLERVWVEYSVDGAPWRVVER